MPAPWRVYWLRARCHALRPCVGRIVWLVVAVTHGSLLSDGLAATWTTPYHNIATVLGIQPREAARAALVLIDARRVQFDLVLAGEKALATVGRLAVVDSALCQLLLLAFLKTVGEIRGSIAAHINLNLVQTLSHAARLSSAHLIKRKLLGPAS